MNLELLTELIEKYGSPLYIYDYEILQDRCEKMMKFKETLKAKLKHVKINIHYSSKANSNPAILKIVKNIGLYADSMSPFELKMCQKSGFNKKEILYVCNNIDKNEMKLVNKEGILICFDSISQVEAWGELFPNTDIMIRINPGIRVVGHSKKVITSGKETKFGISEENFTELLRVIKKHNLNLIGIHQHLGSLFLNDKIDDYIQGVKSGLELINKYFPNIKILDLGGGFGVPYKPEEKALDLNLLADRLCAVLKDFLDEIPNIHELKFEPGRYIPCESGMIIGKVIANKYENKTWWIGTDIGMNQLVRPSMYNAYHEISILTHNEEKNIVKANVCGNICESSDILGKNIYLPLPNIDDIIIVKNAGAYGYSMASNYTGRLRPAEVMIYGDNSEKLIRKRETIEYLEENIVWD